MIAQVLAWIVVVGVVFFVGGLVGGVSEKSSILSRMFVGWLGIVGIVAAIALAILVIGGAS